MTPRPEPPASAGAPQPAGVVPVAVPPELTRLLDRLFTELCAARADFDTAGPSAREPVVRSLRAVLSFLTRFRIEVDAVGSQVPLGHLLAALQSLDDGTVAPLLRPEKHSGRTPEGLAHDTLMAVTVYFVGLIAEAAQARPDDGQAPIERARMLIARELAKADVRPARGNRAAGITARTVRGWCETLAEDVGCHTEAGRILADLRRRGCWQPPDGMPAGDHERALLRTFREALAAGQLGKTT